MSLGRVRHTASGPGVLPMSSSFPRGKGRKYMRLDQEWQRDRRQCSSRSRAAPARLMQHLFGHLSPICQKPHKTWSRPPHPTYQSPHTLEHPAATSPQANKTYSPASASSVTRPPDAPPGIDRIVTRANNDVGGPPETPRHPISQTRLSFCPDLYNHHLPCRTSRTHTIHPLP